MATLSKTGCGTGRSYCRINYGSVTVSLNLLGVAYATRKSYVLTTCSSTGCVSNNLYGLSAKAMIDLPTFHNGRVKSLFNVKRLRQNCVAVATLDDLVCNLLGAVLDLNCAITGDVSITVNGVYVTLRCIRSTVYDNSCILKICFSSSILSTGNNYSRDEFPVNCAAITEYIIYIVVGVFVIPAISIINVNVDAVSENTGSLLANNDLGAGKHRNILINQDGTRYRINCKIAVDGHLVFRGVKA